MSDESLEQPSELRYVPNYTTTGNPEPCGTCQQCGYQLYVGLKHGCSTVPEFSHNPSTCGTCQQCGGQFYVGLTHQCTIESQLPAAFITPLSEKAKEEMSELEHDYPWGG